jgi:hypothetical protein
VGGPFDKKNLHFFLISFTSLSYAGRNQYDTFRTIILYEDIQSNVVAIFGPKSAVFVMEGFGLSTSGVEVDEPVSPKQLVAATAIAASKITIAKLIKLLPLM